MTKQNDEMIEKITEALESTRSAHKRIDELQLVIKAFYDLASDVKVMANELVNMKCDITSIKNDINKKNDEPSKLMFNMKSTVLNGVVMIIISAVMAIILK